MYHPRKTLQEFPRKGKLKRYTEQHQLQIDKNLVVNAIRTIVIGSKYDLFTGSQEGAENDVMIYSFFGTC